MDGPFNITGWHTHSTILLVQLLQHRDLFRGHALEVGTSTTVRRYGGSNLTKVDVINITPDEGVTIVADLNKAWNVPSDTFDVFLNQFVLHMIEDDAAALYHSIRILKPGGHLLVSFPCMANFHPHGVNYGGYLAYIERLYSPTGVERLLKKMLPPSAYSITVYGNRNARASYAMNIGAEALPKGLLNRCELEAPVLVGVVIRKPEQWQPEYAPQ